MYTCVLVCLSVHHVHAVTEKATRGHQSSLELEGSREGAGPENNQGEETSGGGECAETGFSEKLV